MKTNSINARLDRLEKMIVTSPEMPFPTFIYIGGDGQEVARIEKRKMTLTGKYLGLDTPTPEAVSAALLERYPNDVTMSSQFQKHPMLTIEERQELLENLLAHKATEIRRVIK
jgi:hypothetical protein